MSSEPAVRLDGVTKRFPRTVNRTWRSAVPWASPSLAEAAVLDHVDLEVPRGQALGIIGPNGAGKSTLLRLVAGILVPTAGTVAHRGRIGAMIELGLGFHPDLTGRENVRSSAELLGVDPRAIRARVDAITEFAGLAEVIDVPIREYSTGMLARLGFATATHVDAAILVVDEVLSVGDREFQERCLQRISSLVRSGVTLLFVSHELPLVRAACDRVVVLRDGRLVDDGPPDRVAETYLGRRQAPPDADRSAAAVRRFEAGPPVVPVNDRITFRAEAEVRETGRVDAVQVLLTLPSIDPDLVMVETPKLPPGALAEAGTYAIEGTTTPLPLVGGRLRASLLLLSDAGTELATAAADVAMDGPTRLLKPLYDLRPTVALERQREGRPEAPRPLPRRPEHPVVDARGVAKRFSARRGRQEGDTVALDGVDLAVGPGDGVAVIGPNGAGKSTLLRCIAGVCGHEGSIAVEGRLTAMLELGLGFRGDLDGWENLTTTAALLGASPAELAARRDEIVAFSGVGHAMGQPVKLWSTGMRSRLGFAVASLLPTDVLLIDESLAVGDEEFRRAAIRQIHHLREAGVAVVFVSHDLQLVLEACDTAVRLERGRVVDLGDASEVVERYGGTGWSGGHFIGSGPVRIHDVRLERPRVPTGDSARIEALVEVAEPAPHVRLELSFRDPVAQGLPEPVTPRTVELYAATNVIVGDEGALAEPGWYRFGADTGPLDGFGDWDLTLAAVDTLEGVYLAEAWATLQIGGGKRVESDLPGAFSFAVDLRVEPL